MGIFLIALSVAFGCVYFFKDKKDRSKISEAAIAFAIVMFFMGLFALQIDGYTSQIRTNSSLVQFYSWSSLFFSSGIHSF